MYQKLLKAIAFAAEKHKLQKRKGKLEEPYINHCLQVADLLVDVGKVNNEDVLIASVLHDTIEDTDTSEEEIQSLFGKEVLGYVLEVTDDKSLPKEERKKMQVVNAPKKSDGAKLIKLADKTCNIRDVIQNPPTNWSDERRYVYLAWSEEVVKGLGEVNEDLEKLFNDYLEKGYKMFGK